MATPVPPPLKKKVQSCYELICQKKIRQAETELSKLNKKHKDVPSVKALTIWNNVVQQKNCDSIGELFALLESMKIIEEDDQVPVIVASAFNALGKADKAAEAFGIFAERFGRQIYYSQYFDYLVKAFKFDEQAKVALKMYQNEKSVTNKCRLSVATFIQAASKKTLKEREMGFSYAIKLAEKIFTSELEKKYLSYYTNFIENRKSEYADKRLIINEKKEVLDQWKYPTGFEAFHKIMSNFQNENYFVNEIKESPKNLDERKIAFNNALKNLRNPSRYLENWDDAFQKMLAVFQLDPECDVYADFANLLDELQAEDRKRQLSQDALLACIRFLQIIDHDYGIGKLVNRINEYIERFGHQVDTIHHIIPIFDTLSKEDQDKVLKNNEKILSLFYKYVSPYEEYFQDDMHPDVPVKGVFLLDSDDTSALLATYVPTTFENMMIAYYQRLLFAELMKKSFNCDTPPRCEDLESFVNKWNKVVNILANCKISSSEANLLITEIVRVCADSFWKLYIKFHNAVYLELLICFLIKQRNRSSTPNQVIQLLLLNSCLELGYAQTALKIYDEMDIRALQIESMGFLCDYALESVGRFDDAYKFYETMSANYREFMMEMEDAIIFPYREGRLEQVLDIITRIAENMNSVQRAVQYSRRRFLDAILYSKSIVELQDCLMRDGWPIEHPYDHRDFQLFLQNLPVQEPLYTAFKQTRSYCLCISEISIIRVLCSFLTIFLEHKNGDENIGQLQTECLRLDYYFNLITAGFSAEQEVHQQDDQMAISISNSFNSRVIAPFICLIKLFMEKFSNLLLLKSYNVENILENLPSLDDYRAFFDRCYTKKMRT
uniref:Uncharacterized protein n=1 Tax=Panagrolaimus sp. PS1159 TaxID=55785 RepID=A0AC35G6G1_9BILA